MKEGGAAEAKDPRLIAAICAAIAAYRGEAAESGIRVRKIERAAGRRTAWNLAGLNEAMDSRR
ncbi:MAG: hypothetical protein LBS32_03245 [Clostridiales Family XIII bacterium]|jgi:hypothetical protein|nr:hypothetical protein [Clostridiales Family XIII bacterium]